jgi:hypothetical protein
MEQQAGEKSISHLPAACFKAWQGTVFCSRKESWETFFRYILVQSGHYMALCLNVLHHSGI